MAGMTRHINLDLEDKLFDKLTKDARENGIPRNKLIRNMLGKDNFFQTINKNQEKMILKIDKIMKQIEWLKKKISQK